MTQQRRKEVAIRKVIGSSIISIVGLLNKEFTLLVLLANVFSLPLTWWFYSIWSQKFVYKAPLSITTLILSALIPIVIANITVSFLTIKAAVQNPINSLKCE
jgi:putative ABC transport system permease protein